MRARASGQVVAVFLGSALVGCQPEDPTCIQNLGIDITNVTVDAYNAVIRNSAGAGSWNFNCNKGGSAAITGTVNANSVAYDLRITFNNCAHETLVLNGVLQDTAANGASLATKTESATSDALQINGTAVGCNANPIDATCAVNIYFSGGSWVTDICGLTYP